MDPEIIGLLFFGVALILLALGIHIGIVLALAGCVGTFFIMGNFSGIVGWLKSVPYASIAVYELSVVPLFILMGEFSLYGGISESTYKALDVWVGKVRGGLGIATTWACAAFGATSGSSVAAASVFTKVSLPEMRRAGYESNFACAIIATSSTLAMLIPPSLYMVIFGMLAQTSIARLLMAGVIPGVLCAALISAFIFSTAVLRPQLAPPSKVSYNPLERVIITLKAWPMVILAAIIIGGIYSGVFTPTEAAAVGAFVALVICLAQRKLKWNNLKKSLVDTAFTTAMLNLVIIGATVFSRLLTISGFPAWMADVIKASGLSPLVLVIAINIIFLFLGCFIDALSIMFICLPVFIPVLEAAGIDLIWFGVLTTINLNLGTITPPFGLCVYTVKAVAGGDVTTTGVFRRVVPFFIPILLTMILCMAFPILATFIPTTMMGK